MAGEDDLFKLAERFWHISPTMYDKLAMPSRGHGVVASSGLPRKQPVQATTLRDPGSGQKV
jgi:hypothetical protein